MQIQEKNASKSKESTQMNLNRFFKISDSEIKAKFESSNYKELQQILKMKSSLLNEGKTTPTPQDSTIQSPSQPENLKYDIFSNSQLQDIARYYQIAGRSKLTRSQLVEKIKYKNEKEVPLQVWHDLQQKFFPNQLITISMENYQFPRPRNPIELLEQFKTDYTEEEIKRYWVWMNGGTSLPEIIDLEKKDFKAILPQLQETGLILDQFGIAGIFLSPRGLEFINLHKAFREGKTALYHYSDNELNHAIQSGKKSENEVTIGPLNFNASGLEDIAKNLKLTQDDQEIGDFSIALVIPQSGDKIHWPLLMRNNCTGMLGSLAPKTPVM